MFNNLKKLVAINSYEGGEEIVKFLKDKFTPFAEEIQIIKNRENDNKSILIGLNTKLKDIEPIVLSGHIDTVSPDFNQYRTNPFELTIKGENAYGLGSIDMKSFTAVILDNIIQLKYLCRPHCYFVNNG